MVAYNAVVGAHQDVVNTILPEAYTAVYGTGLLTQDIDINQAGFSKVHFDVTKAPTVNFTALGVPACVKTLVKTFFKTPSDQLTDFPPLDPCDKTTVIDGALDAVSSINFDITLPVVNLVLSFSDVTKQPMPVVASLTLTAVVTVDAGTSNLDVQALNGVVTTGDTGLDLLINSAIVPFLRDYINANFLSAIHIPILNFAGVSLSVPVVQIVDNFLLVFVALGSTPPDLPDPTTGWPTDGVFVSTDATLISTIANTAIQNATSSLPHTSFSEGPFTGDLGVSLSNLTVNILDDGSVGGSIGAAADCNVTFHTPWPLPNFSFGPTINGSIGISAKPSVVSNEVTISDLGVTNLSLNISWGGIPDWVSALINGLLGPLEDYIINTVIAPLIRDALSPIVIPVYNIQPIPVTIGGLVLNIALNNVSTEQLPVAGDTLLVAHGMPSIT